MNIRNTKLYKTMDTYTACSIAEGFSGEESTERELNAAWQYLVDTGICWRLQGWYGRNVVNLIQNGVIKKPLHSHTDYWGRTVPGTND